MALRALVERVDGDVDAIACAVIVDSAVMCIRAPNEDSIRIRVRLYRLTEREAIRVVVQCEQHLAVASLAYIIIRMHRAARHRQQGLHTVAQ